MKIINTNGITYLERFESSAEWYWGTDYASGDLYEAEELYRSGHCFEPNRLIFVHYPDGEVFEPIAPKKYQYFGTPVLINKYIYILIVNFKEEIIKINKWENKTIKTEKEIKLNAIKDCYNLRIEGTPLTLIRQGDDNQFQILWPDCIEFSIGNRESFMFRENNQLIFSEWHEDPDYREEINIRNYSDGKIINKLPGVIVWNDGGK